MAEIPLHVVFNMGKTRRIRVSGFERINKKKNQALLLEFFTRHINGKDYTKKFSMSAPLSLFKEICKILRDRELKKGEFECFALK